MLLEALSRRDWNVDTARLLQSPFVDLTTDDLPDDLIRAPFALDEDQRRCIVGWLRNGMGVCNVTVAGGKCLAKGTLVMLASGKSVPVETLKIGDLLMGPDSKPRRVLSLARGQDELFEVRQKNGNAYVCNGDHILALHRFQPHGNWLCGNRRYETSLATLTVYDYLKLPKTSKVNYRGFKVGVNFPFKKVPLDPYFLGLWLGDGSLHKPAVTSGDTEVISFLYSFAKQMGLEVRPEEGSGCSTFHLVRHGGKHVDESKNPLVGKLKRLSLFASTTGKFIPDIYLRNSRSVRMSLLAGLVDSDGYLKRTGQIEITSVYKRLTDEICWLARSLGFCASVRPKRTSCQNGFRGQAFRVLLRGDVGQVPVRVARKKSASYRRTNLRTRISVKSVGFGDYYGFELDGDGLFLLGDFTVTHNTATFMGAAAMVKRSYPKARFLYITPSERLVKQSFKCAVEFLPGWDISKYGGDTKNNQGTDMVVSTQAMLHRNFEELAKEGWFETFMGVLFDESQHAASETAEQVLLATTAYFRFGASDTRSEEKPMRQYKIHGLLGPLLNTVAPVKLIQSGRIARPHIYIIDNPKWSRKFAGVKSQAAHGSDAFVLLHDRPNVVQGTYVSPLYEYDDDGQIIYKDVKVVRGGRLLAERQPSVVPGHHVIRLEGEEVVVESRYCLLDRTYDRAITRFNERNRLIARWVKYFTEQGWPTLVVATRTMHILILESVICKMIDPDKVNILFGQSTSTERDSVFDWFRSTPGSVLISPLVKEGVSINELKAGVVADYIGDWEYMNQIIGRFMRKKEIDNHAHIAIFIDRLTSGCVRLLDRLQTRKGYYFYHPVVEPSDIEQAEFYDTEAMIEEEDRNNEVHGALRIKCRR
jgi:superfamily II DNA or RNA helicase